MRERLRAALDLLGIRHLVVAIHDPAFPSLPREDLGRGSPYSSGAARFLELMRDLGFDGLQLGPQGAVSRSNPSPYDSTLFSRNTLSIALHALARDAHWAGLLSPETLAALVAARTSPPDRVRHAHVCTLQQRALAEIWETFARERAHGASPAIKRLARGFDRFRRKHADWLERDGLYELLCREHGAPHWRAWRARDGRPHPDQCLWNPAAGEEGPQEQRRSELAARFEDSQEQYAFQQFLFHEQHRRFRSRLKRLGLQLFGDMQVGLAESDAWSRAALLLPGYVLGAPPSRTNPEGQPWNYGVLDPRLYQSSGGSGPGPAIRFFRARLDKLFSEYDSLRIDHPHGLICPWVYAAATPDPMAAVQAGARLFESPDLPDHPPLRQFAIARPGQLDRAQPRHADGWVRDLDEEQVERYATLLRVMMEAARSHGRDTDALVCETLSTCPYPLGRVQDRWALGRFRVTQKADLARPGDVYRGENASPADWTMLGTHDTPSIWAVAQSWCSTGSSRAQAEYLAGRLGVPAEQRDGWVARTASDPGSLAQAKFAELFVGPARQVMVFFTDLFGITAPYNVPGTVSEDNWSLRLTADYEERYARKLRERRALDVPDALAHALRSRGPGFAQAHATLIRDLESLRVPPPEPRATGTDGSREPSDA